MNLKLDELTKEELQKIIEKIAKRLSKEQYEYLQHLITECTEKENTADISPQSLMSQGFVDEKMLQIEEWKQQIEDGKLYLDTEEYEDYGDDYWDREWIVEYYDNQQIGDKIMFMMRFANDCINDRRYQEANSIYEWLWEMEVGTDYEDGYTGGEWYYCHRYETAGITNLICELSGVEKGKKGRDALSVFQSFCF